ncbi:MAG TPA: biotin transporter BioY [Clostridiales bacterium]|nr:biotin transporter BioY [Clostridiales bacterium]
MKTKDIVLIALFAALTAVGGFLNIPTPTVPFSLQFLFCAYAGVLLGAKRAFLSQMLYLGIGLAGIPVFTKGGGIGYVFQPSFGFLLGFAVCSLIIGLIVGRDAKPGILKILAAVLLGLLATYAIGVLYLYFITNYMALPGKEIDLITAVKWGVAPFILFDMIKVVIVAVTSVKILPVLNRLN